MRKRKCILLFFCVVFAMCVGTLTKLSTSRAKEIGTNGCNYSINDAHVKKKGTVSYYRAKSCPDEATSAIKNAMKTWNEAGKEITFKLKSEKKGFATNDSINTVGSRLKNSTMKKIFGVNNAIAANHITFTENGYIEFSDIAINKQYEYGNGQNRDYFDYQGVFTHELGHTLGLRDLYEGDKKLKASSENDLPTMYGESYFKKHSYSVYPFLRSLANGDKSGIKKIEKIN